MPLIRHRGRLSSPTARPPAPCWTDRSRDRRGRIRLRAGPDRLRQVDAPAPGPRLRAPAARPRADRRWRAPAAGPLARLRAAEVFAVSRQDGPRQHHLRSGGQRVQPVHALHPGVLPPPPASSAKQAYDYLRRIGLREADAPQVSRSALRRHAAARRDRAGADDAARASC